MWKYRLEYCNIYKVIDNNERVRCFSRKQNEVFKTKAEAIERAKNLKTLSEPRKIENRWIATRNAKEEWHWIGELNLFEIILNKIDV